ncbi:hypothetical protein ACJJTC_000771, partial [Scirpophaga incertulas]
EELWQNDEISVMIIHTTFNSILVLLFLYSKVPLTTAIISSESDDDLREALAILHLLKTGGYRRSFANYNSAAKDGNETNNSKAILMDQVKRVLLNEIDLFHLTQKETLPETKPSVIKEAHTSNARIRLSSMHNIQLKPKLKSTLKVFLARSTQIPIPLPENNVYCFMNPKSPLCRTLI